MASAAGVAGVRATLDLGSKSSKCVQCGEPESARITLKREVGRPFSRNPVDERIGLFAPVDSSRFAPLRTARAAFLEPGAASSIPPVTKQNRLQPAVFWLRRCSLAFMISL